MPLPVLVSMKTSFPSVPSFNPCRIKNTFWNSRAMPSGGLLKLLPLDSRHRQPIRIVKIYSRSAKGGEKGGPNRNPWLAKMHRVMLTKKTQNYRYQNYCPGWQYSNLFIWPSMWARLEHAHCLETINNMWFLRSNWSPTYILHLFHLEDTSLLFIFLFESVKVRFLARVDTLFCPRTTCCLLFPNSAHAYPKLLSFSVLTFIKWRLTPSYAAKETIFWQKRPKTIVIRIIVLDDNLNPSKSTFFHALTLSLLPKNHMLFIVSKQWACSRRVHIAGHMIYICVEIINACNLKGYCLLKS
jgi:hypothetical protein